MHHCDLIIQQEHIKIKRYVKWIGIILLFNLVWGISGCKTQSVMYKNIKIERNKIVLSGPDINGDFSKNFDYVFGLAIKYKKDSICIEKGTYFITGPISLSRGLVIYGISQHEVVIEQLTWGYPVFDLLNADSVTISNMTLVTHQPRTYPNGFVSRATDGFVNNAGIYSNASFGDFRELTIEGFTCGIFLSSWNGVGLYEKKAANRIHDVEVKEVDFGLLATGQKDLVVNHLTGSYAQQSGSGASPHLIYISDSTDPAYVWSENISISNCFASDSPLGIAYQIGSVRGGTLSNLSARKCNGLLSMKNVRDVVIDSLVAIDDYSPEAGSFFILPDGVQNLSCNYIRIESLNPRARLMRIDGIANRFSNIHLLADPQSINDIGIVTVEGRDHILSDIHVATRNPGTGSLGVRLQGVHNKLEGLECSSCMIGFSIMEDCQDCEVIYDRNTILYPDTRAEPAPNYNYSKTSRSEDLHNQ